MILNSAPQNEAVVSNVGEIGEFRIRNSAKAFNILSSGLYANKIRAIIRELSCNAIDAHKAAGNIDQPFDVHLPNSLEPWFSIRDYGIGLNHDQVTNIYTTYFESTKTASNDFIGALGLGSKSPFSYTDNFTVTAIKDGRKGIYTAFINDSGVPSIALMTELSTTESNGVEIKFSVNERYDYDKFRQEAQYVYRYFERVPNVTGCTPKFEVQKVIYDTRDIIPGVHSYGNGANRSIAIMGNIAYPIDVPNADKNLGDLRSLLSCGLEMHFGIGELDFQASREGLSYIQVTIDSIKKKLEKVNESLTEVLAKEADAITNKWERSIFLHTKRRLDLWRNAVNLYAQKTKFELFTTNSNLWTNRHTITVDVEDLKNKFNIGLSRFNISSHDKQCRNQSSETYRKDSVASPVTWGQQWSIPVVRGVIFVENDLKVGAVERAKHHFRMHQWDRNDSPSLDVFVAQAVDKNKPVKFKEFMDFIHNPPEKSKLLASTLKEKPRAASIGRNVTILELTEKTRQRGWRDETTTTWSDAGSLSSFNDKDTYVYAPLSGFTFLTTKEHNFTVHDIHEKMQKCGIPSLKVRVFGVRKADIEEIKKKKNWINIEEFITAELAKVDPKVFLGSVKSSIDTHSIMRYSASSYRKMVDESPLKQLQLELQKVSACTHDMNSLNSLSRLYGNSTKFDYSTLLTTYQAKVNDIYNRYPMLKHTTSYPSTEAEKAYVDYINMTEANLAQQTKGE